MAEIALQMIAIGTANEECTGCETAFQRGEMMFAIKYDNGDPAGWFCPKCIKQWVDTGEPPTKREAGAPGKDA
jgi:hypothetical protein